MVQDTPVTDRDFAALFREEAGSILTEQQINDEIEREQTRSAQAARAGIAPNRFRGFNLQRYCKDIVRSHQPLSCLYLLLSDLTGAVSVLLPICCLLWVVRRLIAFPLSGLLSVSVFTAFRLFAAADFAHCLAVPFQMRPHCVKKQDICRSSPP